MTELKEGVPLPDAGAAWHGLVRDLDPRSGFRAPEACTMMSLCKSLRRGSVRLDHSLSFRERDQMLFPPADWAVQRDGQVELLGMPRSAAEFLEPLLANLMAGMSAVAEAHLRGKIDIGADSMLHLPTITALPDCCEPCSCATTSPSRTSGSRSTPCSIAASRCINYNAPCTPARWRPNAAGDGTG